VVATWKSKGYTLKALAHWHIQIELTQAKNKVPLSLSVLPPPTV
jgi:hypothetical protein